MINLDEKSVSVKAQKGCKSRCLLTSGQFCISTGVLRGTRGAAERELSAEAALETPEVNHFGELCAASESPAALVCEKWNQHLEHNGTGMWVLARGHGLQLHCRCSSGKKLMR